MTTRKIDLEIAETGSAYVAMKNPTLKDAKAFDKRMKLLRQIKQALERFDAHSLKKQLHDVNAKIKSLDTPERFEEFCKNNQETYSVALSKRKPLFIKSTGLSKLMAQKKFTSLAIKYID